MTDNKFNILLIHNIGRAERDFHGPSYGDAFEVLGHHVTRIDHDQRVPVTDSVGNAFDFMFHFYHSIKLPVIEKLKSAGITTVLILGDEPCEFNRTSKFTPWYDIVFNQTGGSVNIKQHRDLGANMFSLPHCADIRKYHPVDVTQVDAVRYGSTIAFIGTLADREERAYMYDMFKDYDLVTWGPGTMNDRWIYPTEVNKIYAASTIIFNPSAVADQPDWNFKYPTLLGATACRVFNTAAAGAFQVAPQRDSHLFQPFSSNEVAYYDHGSTGGNNHLLSIIGWYLDDEFAIKRHTMAMDSRLRVLAHHTYEHRALAVLNHICEYRKV